MTEAMTTRPCQITCWGISALGGLIALVLVWPGVSVLAAVMFAGGFAWLLALSLTRMFCLDPGMAGRFGLSQRDQGDVDAGQISSATFLEKDDTNAEAGGVQTPTGKVINGGT